MTDDQSQTPAKKTGPTVVAACLSLFLPGAGQLYNGQPAKGVAFFIAAFLLWFVFLGWAMSIWSAIDAAVVRWNSDGPTPGGRRH